MRRPIPPHPQNVRVVLTDGREIPVECVHAGYEGRVAVWEVITKVDPDMVAGVRADRLPGRTAIRFPLGFM